MKSRTHTLPLLAALAGLALATSAQAASVAIINHSFEDARALNTWGAGKNQPAVAGGSTYDHPGWIDVGGFGGDAGTGWTTPGQYPGGIPDGDLYAWTNNTSGQDTLSQNLGVDLEANTTYTLNVAVGRRDDLKVAWPTFPGYGIELWAGGVKVASDYDTTNGGTGTNPAPGAWVDATAVFTSGPTVTPDQALQIRLVGFFEPANPNGWGIQTNYDNVRLDATLVPEPSTAAFLGLGGLALLRRRRK